MKIHTFYANSFMKTVMGTSALLVATSVAQAQITPQYRRDNAVVLYEFSGDSNRIVRDTAAAKFGAPLNLRIHNNLGVGLAQNPDHLHIDERSLILSDAPATKLINTCKTNQELTIEVVMENNEGLKPRMEGGGRFPGNTFQPGRIVSLSENILKNNFTLGQFYDGTDFFANAVNTSGVENPANPGASLSNLLRSEATQIIIPSIETDSPPNIKKQTMVFTLNKDAVARVYLSDREGNLSRRALTSTGFRTANNDIFNTWYPNAKLSLGNVATDIDTVFADSGDYRSCTNNAQNPAICPKNSRYWKGKLYLVAIYCQALTDQQILGDRSQQMLVNEAYPIDPNFEVTPNLKKAQEIYERLTGAKVPIYAPVLGEMALDLDGNDPVAAAGRAIVDPRFYNITLRDMAAKISTRAQTIDTPLNDFITTFIGATYDNLDARKLLTENMVYEANPAVIAVPSSEVSDRLRSDSMFTSLQAQRADLTKVLIRKKQRIFDGRRAVDLPDDQTAGLLTTRTFLASHAIAGTTRRPIEKTLEHFLCFPMEKLADSSGPDNVVGKDIDRAPGGAFTKFNTTCKACHTVLDGFRPAFSFFTFNNNYVMHSFTSPTAISVQGNTAQNQEDNGTAMNKSTVPGATYVHNKLNHNDTDTTDPRNPQVKPGAYVYNDSWINNANLGANAKILGWNQTTGLAGKGVKSFGRAVAESKQFPVCLATRVFASICKRDPGAAEQSYIKKVAADFSNEGQYKLKYLFQRIVGSDECMGLKK